MVSGPAMAYVSAVDATTPDLSRIHRDLRWLKAYAAIVTVALVAMGMFIARSPSELRAERIDIVDPSGVTRLVIANSERFPLPRLGGVEYPRAVAPAGMVFYDASGDELGGVAITDASAKRIAALAFDYPNYDAIGLFARADPGGQGATAGLQINSRPPAHLDVIAASRVVQRRVAIQNENENAEILLADPQGRDRIRLRVDAAGDASIEILDSNGNVTFRAPPVRESR